MLAKFHQKIVGACQSFQFFRQPGFRKLIELCLNLSIGFYIALLVLSN